MNTRIRVLTVDDHALLREGVASIVNAEEDMYVVAEAANGQEAIQQFRLVRPDVVLMDIQLPDINGIDAIIGIRAESPNARILVLTTYLGDVHISRALRAGALGYMLKGNVHRELLSAIRTVYKGGRQIPPEIAAEVAMHIGGEELSDREIQVLRRIAVGERNKEIAFELSITEETVKSHLRSMFGKLEVKDRTHAVTTALKRGIFSL